MKQKHQIIPKRKHSTKKQDILRTSSVVTSITIQKSRREIVPQEMTMLGTKVWMNVSLSRKVNVTTHPKHETHTFDNSHNEVSQRPNDHNSPHFTSSINVRCYFFPRCKFSNISEKIRKTESSYLLTGIDDLDRQLIVLIPNERHVTKHSTIIPCNENIPLPFDPKNLEVETQLFWMTAKKETITNQCDPYVWGRFVDDWSFPRESSFRTSTTSAPILKAQHSSLANFKTSRRLQNAIQRSCHATVYVGYELNIDNSFSSSPIPGHGTFMLATKNPVLLHLSQDMELSCLPPRILCIFDTTSGWGTRLRVSHTLSSCFIPLRLILSLDALSGLSTLSSMCGAMSAATNRPVLHPSVTPLHTPLLSTPGGLQK